MADAKKLKGRIKDLADRHAHIPHVTAATLAGKFGGQNYDDLLSIAGIAYVRVAASFIIGEAHNGEDGFGPYVMCWLKKIVTKRFLQRRDRDAMMCSLSTPVGRNKSGSLSDILPFPQHEEQDARSEGLLKSSLPLLEGPARDFLLMRYRECLTWKAIAERMGVNHARVGKIREQAMAVLRRELCKETA